MKRLLPLTLLVLALAAPSVVLAKSYSYEWRTDIGSGAEKVSTTGSCLAKKGVFSLSLSCRGRTGSATARYDFTLPGGVNGTVDKKVSFTGSEPVVKLTRAGDKVSVYVTRTGAGTRTSVQMVSICFYD
ncbi:MAG: hypothetical protein QOJ13_3159 [Gaiellales bacterium]|jgi:hypothetical protein|nr:hypothetical protein [Gaiellales bacterium]